MCYSSSTIKAISVWGYELWAAISKAMNYGLQDVLSVSKEYRDHGGSEVSEKNEIVHMIVWNCNTYVLNVFVSTDLPDIILLINVMQLSIVVMHSALTWH